MGQADHRCPQRPKFFPVPVLRWLVGKRGSQRRKGQPRPLGWTEVEAGDAARGMHRFEKWLVNRRFWVKIVPFLGQPGEEPPPIGEQVIHPQNTLVEELPQVRRAEPGVKVQVPSDQPLEALPLSF